MTEDCRHRLARAATARWISKETTCTAKTVTQAEIEGSGHAAKVHGMVNDQTCTHAIVRQLPALVATC